MVVVLLLRHRKSLDDRVNSLLWNRRRLLLDIQVKVQLQTVESLQQENESMTWMLEIIAESLHQDSVQE